MVQGDENHVRHILENLVENAIKYTEKGTVAVGAYPEAEPETITFIVSDTGMGIPPNRRESIFSPFDRADQDRTATKGTGLGLAICRELATLLGGDVVLVESSPGGSVFRLSLPLRRIEAKSPAPPDTRDPDRVARDASLQAAESIESAAPVSERLQPPDEAIPPIDDIQKLRQIARKGDIAALSEHAERGLRGDPRFATFYGTLARYASQFEIQKIRELIDAVHSQR
jgi:anti-sigma regulatory factor (Ser/Thr protein kinase)